MLVGGLIAGINVLTADDGRQTELELLQRLASCLARYLLLAAIYDFRSGNHRS